MAATQSLRNHRVFGAVFVIVVAYLTLVPVSNNIALYPLLISIGIVSVVQLWKTNMFIDRGMLVPLGLWGVFVLFGITTALLQGAEWWLRTLVFFLVAPAFYVLVVGACPRRFIRLLLVTAVVCTIAVSAFFLIGAIWITITQDPNLVPPAWLNIIGVMFHRDKSGEIAIGSFSLAPLLWWGSMWIASLAVRSESEYLPPLWIRYVAATLVTAAVVVSGRRAIVVVVVAAPLLVLLAYWILKTCNRQMSAGLLAPWKVLLKRGLLYMAPAYLISFLLQPSSVGVVTQLASSVGKSLGFTTATLDGSPPSVNTTVLAERDTLSDVIRQSEVNNILSADSWTQVVFGRGFGAEFIRGDIEREIRPWQTDLPYHGLYYWTGIVGLLIVIAVIISTIILIRRAARLNDSLNPVLFLSVVGAAAILLGNVTNPYSQPPGHMWVIFFPMIVANIILRSHEPQRQLGFVRRRVVAEI